MIRVSVLYPNSEGAAFDHTYFMETHAPMVAEQLGGRGLISAQMDKGISDSDPNQPPPFIMIVHLTFNTVEDVHNAFTATGRQIMGDIPNYTNIRPQVQISEIISG
jgi:uncharacterized protein (TIGR02118 family)